jgi:hypothetical protein
VQSEGQVVGTYSDVERMVHPNSVIGDMLHINYSYGESVKDAIAKHPLSCHFSEDLAKNYAHMFLMAINKLWHAVAQHEVSGSIPFLITQGAQFAQENHTMPNSAKCVDIFLRYKFEGKIVEHMYTKFLIRELDQFKD